MTDEEQRRRKDWLLRELERCKHWDGETAHEKADRALLTYINDEDVTLAFDAVPGWYS